MDRQSSELPANRGGAHEEERLQALRESTLLSCAGDAVVERIVKQAGTLLGRRWAAFSLLDRDCQIIRFGSRELHGAVPRGYSFCSHTIAASDGALVVGDASVDARFAGNPYVTGKPHVRSYAGIAVHDPARHRIGALCVSDSDIRDVTAVELGHLRQLAVQLETRIAAKRHRIAERREFMRDLRAAVASSDLRVFWQPVIEARSLCPKGYEALVRWNRKDGTPVPPDRFIPPAERAGLISLLDSHVLRSACNAAAGWGDTRTVSVNISAKWFEASPALLPDLVVGALRRSGLAPERLVLELTERVLVADPPRAAEILDHLKSLGVRLALDDFGTGFSSLGYLAMFLFDVVKLDRSFVQRLGSSARADTLVQSIVQMVHAQGMQVCVEGVETSDQLHFLQDAGCDLVQGYLLGRPAPEPV